MGVFDTIKETQVPVPQSDSVIKTRINLKKGYLFGHISNGNGLIKLGNGYAIKVVALSDSDVALYLLDYGMGGKIQSQTWQKTKSIGKAKPKPGKGNKKDDTNKIESKDAVEEESLFGS